MTAQEELTEWPDFVRVRRAIVVVDIVESVPLIERHEADVIARWRAFVRETAQHALPAHGGRLVKSLGDGMLIEFPEVHRAVDAALDMHARIETFNVRRADDERIRLRAAVHVCEVIADELDVLGHGVNLTARLAGLAGAGETVISADMRDTLLADDHIRLEDLGECELRGVSAPTRAYRVLADDDVGAIEPFGRATLADAMPTLAMLPLSGASSDPHGAMVAELVFDQLLQKLSRAPYWRVISRLTMAAYRNRTPTLDTLKTRLAADYVVSGRVYARGRYVRVSLEMADAQAQTVIWSGDTAGAEAELFADDCGYVHELGDAIGAAIVANAVRRSRTGALPTLRSYALLYGGVALMHRLSRADFERSEQMLSTLVERHPNSPEPLAWLSKWHVMRVAQGWSPSPKDDARSARALTKRALDQQSDHSLALAVDGLAAAFLLGDLDTSEQRYTAALASNPNEALAWLFLSALHTYRDRDEEAVRAVSTALSLSPLDPMRYFFDAFAANAMTAAGRYEEAIALAERSIRANCTHMPTHRAMAIAQMLSGQGDQARQSIQRLLRVHPGYTVQEFEERYAGRGSRHAAAYGRALREAGLPER